MRILTLAILLLSAADLQAVEYIVIAANTNLMTQGQINALGVFQGEHFPPDMMDKTNKRRQVGQWVDYTDGTNSWRVNCFAVQHLEKVHVRRKYTEVDGKQIEDVSKRKSYGRKATALRIGRIREPFDGKRFKIERVAGGQQGAKLVEWGLTPVAVKE